MPVTRRSTRSSTGAGGKQQTLSFKHKVTKSIQSGGKKDGYKSPSRSKEYIPEPSPEPATIKKAADEAEEEVKEDVPTQVDTKAEAATDADHDRKLQQIKTQAKPIVDNKSEAELRAEKISDAAIERYWAGIESSRMAKAVHKKHTEGLSTGEKVLRYFDVSSQYGPCIGIARIKRWQRAQRLGLNPPIEVLAVLMKEDAKGNKDIERAHMDEILNSTAIGSV
ncbi:DNA polymerase delta subunit 4 [Madurella mycetomatis]|uniref:DNA polymerase delta subunit 4 n=1 Tax=Madurella mycetomatis TaxID=100816 RepID=A0A175W0D4_9PEZI|nr:DNA polymerase delta subunit 4 [Madurella mycetomatis]